MKVNQSYPFITRKLRTHTSRPRPHHRRARLSRRLFVGMTLVALLGGMASRSEAAVIYVNANQTNNVPDGTAWSTAYPQVQPAIQVASDGDAVWVAAGTYFENLTLSNGAALYGGFAGTETQLEQRDWTANRTILDGRQSNRIVQVTSPTNLTRVDGFIIQNGSSAIYSSNAAPSICNNLIWHNRGSPSAIGIFRGSCIVASNLIQENVTSSGTAGISCNLSAVKIYNNQIVGNTGTRDGVGIYCSSSTATPEIVGNLISGNVGGSAVYIVQSSAVVQNNTTGRNGARRPFPPTPCRC
jgi:hypothetical protein